MGIFRNINIETGSFKQKKGVDVSELYFLLFQMVYEQILSVSYHTRVEACRYLQVKGAKKRRFARHISTRTRQIVQLSTEY